MIVENSEVPQISICLLKQSNKDVDIQMMQQIENSVIIQSFRQKFKDESGQMVNWVVSNIPKNIEQYRVSISRGGTELYPVYTELNLLGANVSFCD